MPEWDVMVSTLLLLVLPTLATSLLLMLALMLLLRWGKAEWLTSAAATVSVVLGIYVGNEFRMREPIPWRFDTTRELTFQDFRTALGWSLEAKPPPPLPKEDDTSDTPEEVDEPSPARAAYWLSWLAGLALLIELLARLPRIPPSVAWVARTLVALLAGRLLTAGLYSAQGPPLLLRVEMPWFSWCLGLVILLEWALLLSLTRRWRDGTVPASLVLCLGAASVVLLCAPSPSLSEVALLMAAALLGPAVVAWIWPVDTGGVLAGAAEGFVIPGRTHPLSGDTGGVLAGAAVLLPGLMLLCDREVYESKVPWESCLLLGLAPLMLAPLTLPWLARLEGWKRWLLGLGLPLLPATVAVLWAVQASPPF